jgi:hypothetical protein
MKRLTWQLILGSLGLVILLAGCNFPGRVTETTFPAAEFTVAAQTVVAELTALAGQATPAAAQVQGVAPSATRPSPLNPPGSTPSATIALPTATVTAAPAPTESLKLLFEDDFADEIGWFTEETDDYTIAFAEGGYKMSVEVTYANIWSVRNTTYTDVILEVDAAREAGPEDGYYGLVCRQVDQDNYYGLVISSNGFYGIGKMEAGTFEFLKEGVDASGILKLGANQANRIRAECSGSLLRLSANGKLLVEVEDDAFTEGTAGLMVGVRKQGGLEALFDNFAVYER